MTQTNQMDQLNKEALLKECLTEISVYLSSFMHTRVENWVGNTLSNFLDLDFDEYIRARPTFSVNVDVSVNQSTIDTCLERVLRKHKLSLDMFPRTTPEDVEDAPEEPKKDGDKEV